MFNKVLLSGKNSIIWVIQKRAKKVYKKNSFLLVRIIEKTEIINNFYYLIIFFYNIGNNFNNFDNKVI